MRRFICVLSTFVGVSRASKEEADRWGEEYSTDDNPYLGCVEIDTDKLGMPVWHEYSPPRAEGWWEVRYTTGFSSPRLVVRWYREGKLFSGPEGKYHDGVESEYKFFRYLGT